MRRGPHVCGERVSAGSGSRPAARSQRLTPPPLPPPAAAQAESRDENVLVHCKLGRSRSVCVILGWAMQRHRWPLSKAVALVTELRSGGIQLNSGFESQVILLPRWGRCAWGVPTWRAVRTGVCGMRAPDCPPRPPPPHTKHSWRTMRHSSLAAPASTRCTNFLSPVAPCRRVVLEARLWRQGRGVRMPRQPEEERPDSPLGPRRGRRAAQGSWEGGQAARCGPPFLFSPFWVFLLHKHHEHHYWHWLRGRSGWPRSARLLEHEPRPR